MESNQAIQIKTLEHAKVGDYFMVRCEYGPRSRVYFSTVICEKLLTKKCVIGGQKYYKRTARLVGDRYTGLYEINSLIVRESQLRRLRMKLSDCDWDKSSDEAVEAVTQILFNQKSKE